jgi:diacylglycerol kinase (ATP)
VTQAPNPWRATKELARSFVYAFEGLLYTVYTQRNMRFHLFVAILAMAVAVALKVDPFEKMVLVTVICLVPSFEIINTSIESQADFAGRRHELLKRAKDTAAAAVLVMSLCSMAVGAYVLLPRLVNFFAAGPPPPGVVMRREAFRLLLMLALWGSLILFWVFRSDRRLFWPALFLTSVSTGTSTTWLCIHGRDPASWVAILFIAALLLNAFARAEFEVRVRKKLIREDMPFEIRGMWAIIPGISLGVALGALSAWAWFRGFPHVPPFLVP